MTHGNRVPPMCPDEARDDQSSIATRYRTARTMLSVPEFAVYVTLRRSHVPQTESRIIYIIRGQHSFPSTSELNIVSESFRQL